VKDNGMAALSCYIIQSEDNLPSHLRDRNPFRLAKVDVLFRRPRAEAIASDGRVLMAGAIEFQTQITPGQLTDICDPFEIYKPDLIQTTRFRSVYDPEIQRGEKEIKGGQKVPYLNDSNIESMVEDIRANQFECPQLMWNLRAGEVLWAYVEERRELLIYQGVATRPDTNHRHHGIIKMHLIYRRWVEETESEQMEEYNPVRPYSLTISTDDFEGEAHRFFVLNSKGWKVPTSKAYYIESRTNSPHAKTKLARELMDDCGVLGTKNVEIVQATLSKNSAKLVLFYTLVRGIEAAFPALPADDAEAWSELRHYLIEFVAELGKIRPNEIALLSVQRRQEVRMRSVADQGIFWISYLRLAAWLREHQPGAWRAGLATLGETYRHEVANLDTGEMRVIYTGDLMSRDNPLWRDRGIVSTTEKPGIYRINSNRNAQEQAFIILRDLMERKFASLLTVAA